MKLRITLFHQSGGNMRQQWGTKENPSLYGETTIPSKIWSQIADGKLGNQTLISSLCVEGEGQAASA
jgi:hypothetical protein